MIRLILTTLFSLILLIPFNSNGQIRQFYYERTASLLIDGGIQSVESGGIDKSATGQLGVRLENFFRRIDILFTTASSVGEETKSTDIGDYSRFILNPQNTRTGFDAFHFSYMKRNFSGKGAVVNHARYLVAQDSISVADFDQIISAYDLEKWKKTIHRFGYLIEANVNNFSWTNAGDTTHTGNIFAFNPYVIYNLRTVIFSNPVDIFGGIGPSVRTVAGNIKDESDFIRGLLGNDKTTYLGAQITVQAFIDNFYAKANYGIYGGDPGVDDLTGGQFYVSIGIQAKIGDKKPRKDDILGLIRSDVRYKRAARPGF